jgi:hypothetical protein
MAATKDLPCIHWLADEGGQHTRLLWSLTVFRGVHCGARSRNRTGMALRPADFKSDASTSFAIRARG